MTSRGLRPLSLLTVVLFAASLGLVFFYAPIDQDQGFVQKIFYLHVSIAIVALWGFVIGGWHGLRYLQTGDSRHDLKSYVTIHQAQIYAAAVLITGGIWGRAAWGEWWNWSEPLLVSFLVIFLLYCCYQPLRLAIDDPERQARIASVFAVVAGVFVPVNFAIVRLSAQYLHPRTLTTSGGLPGPVLLTWLVTFAAVAVLYATLTRYELLSKTTTFRLRRAERQLSGDDTIPRRSAVPQA